MEIILDSGNVKNRRKLLKIEMKNLPTFPKKIVSTCSACSGITRIIWHKIAKMSVTIRIFLPANKSNCCKRGIASRILRDSEN